jgi:hypothetical protein
MPRSILLASLASSLMVIAFGCGDSKKPTVNVKGTITFKGKPVATGFINFMPDIMAGNQGEVKGFEIVDGTYDTAKGSNPGIYAGANTVTISGFDGKKQNMWPKGKQIFNPHEFKENLSAGSKDFVVPDSAGVNVKIVPTADPDPTP